MPEYRIYHNVQSGFQPYVPGDRLWFDGTAYEIPADEYDGAFDLLEPITERHNRDDRPDGQRAPSLSVGDLVALDWGTENTTFWAVERLGWEQVEGPLFTQVVNNGQTLPSDAGYFEAADLVGGRV